MVYYNFHRVCRKIMNNLIKNGYCKIEVSVKSKKILFYGKGGIKIESITGRRGKKNK